MITPLTPIEALPSHSAPACLEGQHIAPHDAQPFVAAAGQIKLATLASGGSAVDRMAWSWTMVSADAQPLKAWTR
jgi:hypothetical protein